MRLHGRFMGLHGCFTKSVFRECVTKISFVHRSCVSSFVFEAFEAPHLEFS